MVNSLAIAHGDWIWPEIIDQGERVIKHFLPNIDLKNVLIGHASILETWKPITKETIDIMRNSTAVLLWSVGHPSYGIDAEIRPEQWLLTMRKELETFANIRPIQTFSALSNSTPFKSETVSQVDFQIFRELTSGIYFWEKWRSKNSAYDKMQYTEDEIQRIWKKAFEAAIDRESKVSLVVKDNVLETSKLWVEVINKLHRLNYPQVKLESLLVDSVTARLNENPKSFDVLLTGNLFWDILSDQSATLLWSLWMWPSASIGENNFWIYEPIHGSAPDIAGKDIANPIATILSVGMMLEISFGMKNASEKIRKSVEQTLTLYRTKDIAEKGYEIIWTRRMWEEILRNLESLS